LLKIFRSPFSNEHKSLFFNEQSYLFVNEYKLLLFNEQFSLFISVDEQSVSFSLSSIINHSAEADGADAAQT